MIFLWLAGGLLGAMVVVHMARPYYEKRRLSQAQFFANLSSLAETERRWRPGNPLRSYAFYLRLLFLLLLLLAFWLTFADYTAGLEETRPTIGLWLFIDTSASMSVIQNGQSRLQWAQAKASLVIEQALQAAENSDVCFRLSTFDLERRDWRTQADAPTLIITLLQLEVRPLGTDLGLIRTAANELSLADAQNGLIFDCPTTHLLVITDMPAPDWLAEIDVPIIWQDIAIPVDNVGFTDVYAARDPLTGLVNQVYLEVTAYGMAPTAVQITVEGPTGAIILEERVADWAGALVWRGAFTPDAGGVYRMGLSPGGAYAYDDVVELFIEEISQLHVDWQLADTTIPDLLNWRIMSGSDLLRVVSYGTPLGGETPTLLVGNGYGRLANQPQYILDFEESSPLLIDVNLDAVEQVGLPGVRLPADFMPVLRGEDEGVWLAQRRDPPAAYIPGLPVFQDDNLGRFSTLVFLNAVQWLVQQQPHTPLYTLTSPEKPEVGAGRLALHPGEGNTATIPFSRGELTDLQAVRVQRADQPVWHFLLLLVAAVFLAERGLSAYGGGRWR